MMNESKNWGNFSVIAVRSTRQSTRTASLSVISALSAQIKRLTMPIISMFYGIIIWMYLLDGKHHNLPHIRARYEEFISRSRHFAGIA